MRVWYFMAQPLFFFHSCEAHPAWTKTLPRERDEVKPKRRADLWSPRKAVGNVGSAIMQGHCAHAIAGGPVWGHDEAGCKDVRSRLTPRRRGNTFVSVSPAGITSQSASHVRSDHED